MPVRRTARKARRPDGPPRVAVLVETSTSWGRHIVGGIHEYHHRGQPWQLFIEARGANEHLRVPRNWSGDGVIARVATPLMAAELRALRIPVVNVSAIQLPGVRFPRVQHDTAAGAAMAARYLGERGFRHFAYFSLLDLPYVAAQQLAFRAAVRRLGGTYSACAVRPGRGAEPDWNLDPAPLLAWLRSLPKPAGLLTWNASCGRQIIHLCQQGGLRIPEDIALISGADDDLLCEISHIPISAVRVASEQIGRRAAALLDDLMQGHRAPPAILVPPPGVISRRSTDVLPIPDRAVAKAVAYIRAQSAHRIRVCDVAQHAGVSRRVLERRFRATLARTPADEIRRAHRDAAMRLLGETDLPVSAVARAAGFGSADYLAQMFRSQLGRTPLQYRRTLQGR